MPSFGQSSCAQEVHAHYSTPRKLGVIGLPGRAGPLAASDRRTAFSPSTRSAGSRVVTPVATLPFPMSSRRQPSWMGNLGRHRQ